MFVPYHNIPSAPKDKSINGSPQVQLPDNIQLLKTFFESFSKAVEQANFFNMIFRLWTKYNQKLDKKDLRKPMSLTINILIA